MNAVSLRHYIMEAVEEEDQSCLAAVNRLERPTDWLIWLPSNGPRTSYCRRFPRTFGAVSLMQVFLFLINRRYMQIDNKSNGARLQSGKSQENYSEN